MIVSTLKITLAHFRAKPFERRIAMKIEATVRWMSDRTVYYQDGYGFYKAFIEKTVAVEEISELRKAVVDGINPNFNEYVCIEIKDTDPTMIDWIRFRPYNYELGYSRCENSHFLLNPKNLNWAEVEKYFLFIRGKSRLAKYIREAFKKREQLRATTRG